MKPPPIAELSMDELKHILARARMEPLSEGDCQKLEALMETLLYLSELAEDRNTTIAQLRQILVRSSSEKLSDIFPDHDTNEKSKTGTETSAGREPETAPASGAPAKPKSQANGHGRNGASAYAGAHRIPVAHPSLQSGDGCPGCQKGKVYRQRAPGMLVRVVGQAPIQATVYELEKFRCNLCGEVFTAEAPQGVGPEKYDASSGSMIALLKYGSGFPFYRMERLQDNLEIPLPASTQWEIVKEAADQVEPAYEELIRQAAQGQVLYNDDTSMRVLELMKEISADEDRTGIFTSGIVSTRDGQRIALFFTGRQHAGENLSDVLQERLHSLGPPIQMCDALSRNVPKALQVILANCLAHGRRQFVEVAANFPEECRHVLEVLAGVYHLDDLARQQQMSADERLALHQARSGPLMEELRHWFAQQLDEHRVEPNSGLGAAIAYMQKRWDRLTLFLRVSGAPLDNNICERALKKAILHRKNSLFYKTKNGAHVGDIFMSLIYTCQFCGANAFDYLNELQRNSAELSRNAPAWMPWNYRHTIDLAVEDRPG